MILMEMLCELTVCWPFFDIIPMLSKSVGKCIASFSYTDDIVPFANFREFGQKSRNPRKLVPAKISSPKVARITSHGKVFVVGTGDVFTFYLLQYNCKLVNFVKCIFLVG